jgi:LemA protein
MLIAIIVIVVLLLAIGIYLWVTYNRLVSLRLSVDNSWSQIEVTLKRRHDLIPNLVQTVRGYATHERETFENVTEARSQAMAAQGPRQSAAAESGLGMALGRLMAVAENYPQLRATENFQKLQNELTNTEDQIAIARRVYNDTVQTLNTKVQQFPSVIVARQFHFSERDFFDAQDAEVAEAPQVDFRTTPPPAAVPAAGDSPTDSGATGMEA